MPDEPADRRPSLFGTVAANPLIVLTVSGLALFALSRGAYQMYYGRFGVTPEEVGLDYVGLLSRQAFSVLSVAGLVMYAASPGIVMYRRYRRRLALLRYEASAVLDMPPEDRNLFESAVREQELRYQRDYEHQGERQRRRLWSIASLAGFLAVVAWAVALFLPASEAGTGEYSSPFYLPFQVHTAAVSVMWREDDGAFTPVSFQDLGLKHTAKCPAAPLMLYLGRSNGVVVLFEECTHRAIRLPADQVYLG